MTRIINFFGAPGSGKTTAAAETFVYAKKKGLSAYLVQEYATDLVLQNNIEALQDQYSVFDEQLRRMKLANGKVDLIMDDSPLLLAIVYRKYRHKTEDKAFNQKVIQAHHAFNQVNVLLKYNPKYYSANGRVTSQNDSFVIEQLIRDTLKESDIPFIEIDSMADLEKNLDNLIEKEKK